MRRNTFLYNVVIVVLASFVAIACAQQQPPKEPEMPSRVESNLVEMTATVESVDMENRVVTLKNSAGKQVTIDVDENVKNLSQVEVGDQVKVKFYESLAIQVRKPEGTETASLMQATGKAKEGERPAGVMIDEVTVVTTIEAIDKQNETVTLKGPQGNTRTIKVQKPENLEKVQIGDQVVITFTEALAISVEESQ